MKVRGLLVASLVVTAAMVAFAFYTASLLPEGAQLPVHFDAAGKPDRYADALAALLIAPGVVLAVSLLMAATPFIEPLQEKLEASASLFRIAWLGLLAIMAFVQLSIAAPAHGWVLPPMLFYIAIGLFFVALGNMLPKSRPSFFVGIRTPWTLTDTDNWIATHRLGGKLMMLAGGAMIAIPFLPLDNGGRVALLIGSLLCAALVPVVYSWWFWRAKKKAARAK
ncbi:MAG TPA: SdpI family protein [Sphingomonadaceae bacterium]|nr:SdpI family protein [Sphingomonadaceae bacterium]